MSKSSSMVRASLQTLLRHLMWKLWNCFEAFWKYCISPKELKLNSAIWSTSFCWKFKSQSGKAHCDCRCPLNQASLHGGYGKGHWGYWWALAQVLVPFKKQYKDHHLTSYSGGNYQPDEPLSSYIISTLFWKIFFFVAGMMDLHPPWSSQAELSLK